jgi:hypothetical protein
MDDIIATEMGQVAPSLGDDAGTRMAREAQQEIERRGLEGELAAWYVAEQNAVRLGRPGAGGHGDRGIDYPVHPSYFGLLVDHLQVLARRDAR